MLIFNKMLPNIHKLALTVCLCSLGAKSVWASQEPAQGLDNESANIIGMASQKGLPQGFAYLADVAPTILQDVRYAGNFNFVGRPIKGYKQPKVILTMQAAQALAAAQAALQEASNGKLTLKVYDGYRPQRAVNDFWKWAQDPQDQKMKPLFYPNIADKELLFQQGYIDKKSGHSRGSTVDLTIVALNDEHKALTPQGQNEFTDDSIDMGSPFDLFDPQSHYICEAISAQAQENRTLLRELMLEHGFVPYEKEWWHFTLHNEPFPNTYFDFPIQ